jgi:hypothetical protein
MRVMILGSYVSIWRYGNSPRIIDIDKTSDFCMSAGKSGGERLDTSHVLLTESTSASLACRALTVEQGLRNPRRFCAQWGLFYQASASLSHV